MDNITLTPFEAWQGVKQVARLSPKVRKICRVTSCPNRRSTAIVEFGSGNGQRFSKQFFIAEKLPGGQITIKPIRKNLKLLPQLSLF